MFGIATAAFRRPVRTSGQQEVAPMCKRWPSLADSDSGIVLETPGQARATVDPVAGGRLASLRVFDHEVLVTAGPGPFEWGCFPMVPFAGSIRRGLLRFDGREYSLPTSLPPHAIHGTLFGLPWDVVEGSHCRGRVALEAVLREPWPFAGSVTETFSLQPDSLNIQLELRAAESMPAWVGWHPWFSRLVDGVAGDIEFDIEPHEMWLRDGDGIQTGELVRPPARPWDDCFSHLRSHPRMRWPGLIDLELESDTAYWVIFDEDPRGICIEPQTAPPKRR
jgi:galactose mutarotase-like enzyme